MASDVADRFFAKVEWSDHRHGGTRCLVWTGCLVGGYGQFCPGAGRRVKAHRWLYERWAGPIPAGLVIDHLCRNRACVNPDHMEPVTNRENLLRGVGLTAENARKTHCKRGHEFTPENTYSSAKGRECRICKAFLQRTWNPSPALTEAPEEPSHD